MHRLPSVFPDPYLFNPERWLSKNETDDMKAHFMPFGYGGRICGGQAMATMMLKITVAAMARNFNIQANLTETNEKTMVVNDSFVSVFTGCFLGLS